MKMNGHQNGHSLKVRQNGASHPSTPPRPKVFSKRSLGAKLLHNRGTAAMVFQAGLILFSVCLAWLLRFDFSLPDKRTLLTIAPLLILIRLAAIRAFNLHHGWWRYTGVMDALNVVKAVVSGSIAFYLVMQIFSPSPSVWPRSIYVLEALLTAGTLSGARLVSRAISDSMREDLKSGKRVLLLGAGAAARIFIKEMSAPVHGYSLVGLVDDDASKKGLRILGVEVLGTVDQLPELVSQLSIEEVLIVVPSATREQLQRFISVCNAASVRFRTVPGLAEIISGDSNLQQLREVRLEDLLGRLPADIDLESVRKQIAGHCILVTGAAGSIGSELCKQILKYKPATLVCVDQNENGLFHLQNDITRKAQGTELLFRVADITDESRIRTVLSERVPSLLFHAAAYKHVPMMESNVQEAVKNNVFGLLTLLDAAESVGCAKFVSISSDKAVNPVSVMGATKRICELVMASRPRGPMCCASVRFGNVLGSAGSVVPLLQKQIRENDTLTITDPQVRRFFMVISEAVGLVLQASVIGNHGDILVLEMGEQVLILDLAKDLIRLCGRPQSEVNIEFTGLRDGEKIEEELFYATEKVVPTFSSNIVKAQGRIAPWSQLHSRLRFLEDEIASGDAESIRSRIKDIVPEYATARSVNGFDKIHGARMAGSGTR